MKERVAIFHLLNDFSGSPIVLKSIIENFLDNNVGVDLFSSKQGPLDSINHRNFRKHNIPYSFSNFTILTLFRYIYAQILSFFAALKFSFSGGDRFYINTILPVGAAIGAKLTCKHISLHCHENPRLKSKSYRFLSSLMLKLADEIFCVSKYQASLLSDNDKIHILPNRLCSDFIKAVRPNPEEAFDRKSILMLASLKKYKGIDKFIELAAALPQYHFSLVVNDSKEKIDNWIQNNSTTSLPNLKIYPRQTNTSQFYNNASIVVNLSDSNMFIETFGMTALEARACRLPVITPTIGGITEIIHHDVNGYNIDSHHLDDIKQAILNLLSDRNLYLRLANAPF